MDVTFRSGSKPTQQQVKMPEGSKPKMHIHNSPAKTPSLAGFHQPKMKSIHADTFQPRNVKKDVSKSVAGLVLGGLMVVGSLAMKGGLRA